MRARFLVTRAVVATMTIATLALAQGGPALAAPPHKISIADASITEGNAGSSDLTFTLTVTGPARPGLSTDYATTDATATAGSDYTATSGNVTLANGGCKCAYVSVPILGDTTPELNETFTVTLSNPGGGATYQDSQAIGTIANDDNPNAAIDDPSVAEVAGTMTFTVTLDQASPFDAVIGYATASGTATDGADYTGAASTLTIAAGDTTGTIDISILDDATYEGEEDFTLDLTPISGVVVDDTQGLGTITEDDPGASIAVDDAVASEGAGTMTFTISLDGAASVDVSVDYATADTTATDGVDYTGAAGTTTILAGDTSATVDVAISDDSIYEGDEMLNLDLSGEVNGVLADAQGQGTVTEDDPMPTVDVDSPTVAEADGTATFTVSLDATAAVDVSADYVTTDATAIDALDYTGVAGTATVLAGDTAVTVDVPVLDDAVYESDESFTLDLSNEVNGVLGTSSGTATITNDEAVPGVAIADASVAEGNAGTNNMNVSVTLTGPSAFDISVDYASADGAATAGSDYQAATGTLTILAGDTLGQVQVVVTGDTTYEVDEDFTVTLSNLVGAGTIDTTTAAGTISNDDKQPSSLTAQAAKTTKNVKSKGVLEPASTGNQVKVTLSRHRHGTWVKVAVKTVAVKKLADRDSDGLTDGKYVASFPRPATGKYRFKVRFAGDTNTLSRTKKVTFTL